MKKELEINESLSEERIKNYEKAYNKNKTNIVVKNALSRGPISSIVNVNEALLPLQMNFNVEVKTMEVCDQENSGRCWIFAGLNVLREEIAKKLNVKSFELSQNYIAFFDKLEKTNYALCSIIDLLDEKPDDRVLMHILSNAISDGGQWDMLTSLINKYGLCPKYVMNETFASGHTQECNQLINFNIRIFASEA
ncbi:MAG: C1 family peptidase, partial [Bacilli bacterium]